MMRFESETTSATSGSEPTTWKRPSFKVRLVGFALALVVGAFLIIRFDTNIWRAQGHLQEGFAAIKAEKFYFGVEFRGNLRKLTASLLDFRLTGKSSDLQTFRQDAQDLNAWLRAKEGNFVSPAGRAAFTQLESAYKAFLARVDPLLHTNSLPQLGQAGFAAVYSQIRQEAQPVLDACEDVVKVEHRQFDLFLQSSDQALTSLQRLFLLSLLLLIALAVA